MPQSPLTEAQQEAQVNEILAKYSLTPEEYIRIDQWSTNVLTSINHQSYAKLLGYTNLLQSPDFDVISGIAEANISPEMNAIFAINLKSIEALLSLKETLQDLKSQVPTK